MFIGSTAFPSIPTTSTPITMAQDPNKVPGNEEQANDLPMEPNPSQQEINVSVGQYLQMKDGMDKRIQAYSVTRAQLMKMSNRKLEKWCDENCESIKKLLVQQNGKDNKVDLILTGIKKQRALDLSLLKVCREEALKLGVPANLLPWQYGEFDFGNGNGDNDVKNNDNDNGDNSNGKGNGNDNQGKNKNKNNNNSGNVVIDLNNIYQQLDALKKKHGITLEDSALHNGNSNSNSNGNGNGNGNGQVNQGIQRTNKKLKAQVINQIKGARNVPVKHVS